MILAIDAAAQGAYHATTMEGHTTKATSSATKSTHCDVRLSQLYAYLTAGCNLACRHCWLAPIFDMDGSSIGPIDPELLRLAVNEAKPLGLSTVKLTGGEPFLHPEFLSILEFLRSLELAVHMETNGVLCSPRIAQEISKVAHRHVAVSLDGAEAATHEWVRGVPGCFEKTCQGIRNLAEAGTRPQIILSVMRHTEGEIEAVVRLAEKLGASSVKFNVVQPTARGERLSDHDETLSVRELIALHRRVHDDLAKTTKLRLFFHLPMAFRSLGRIASGDGCSRCGIMNIMGVIPSGHYALCGIGEHVPELVFGKIGEDPLETVWRENPVLQQLRSSLVEKLDGVCGRCLMKAVCLGSCVAQNYYRTHDLFAPYWFCEQAEQEGLFPTTRLRPEPEDEA